MSKERNKAPHILNASSNLVGFCFVVITSLKIFSAHEKKLIDEAALIVLLLFISSALFSFLSIRTERIIGENFERIAEVCFASGLGILMIISILFTIGALI